MADIKMNLSDAKNLAYKTLIGNGCDEPNAEAISNRMIQAEADHCFSHGLFRLPWYVEGLKSGRANGKARPKINQLAPAVIQVDGDNGYAPLGQDIAHPLLRDCAHENGIAALAFTNMFHLGAMWPEVEALANEGVCAFAFTASYPYLAPAGGKKPLFGTNPMGFAWPRKNAPPFVFDQASSAMARGDIMIAARDGHDVPPETGIGPNGEATTDPNVVLEGAQLGFGGYKGANLGLMVELLAGPLIGDFLSFESEKDDDGSGGPPKGGELILALDPARFGDPEGFLSHGEKLFDAIAEQEGTRLSGQRRHACRAQTKLDGITIPKSLHETILGLV